LSNIFLYQVPAGTWRKKIKMAIKITTRRNVKAPVWSIVLLVLSIILITGGVLHYLYIDNQLKKLAEKLVVSPPETALKEDVLAKEREINLINSKTGIFEKIILDHKNAVSIFDFLEKICLKNVWFSNFNLNNKEISVFGNADNFVTLEQQIILLKKQPAVNNITLSGAKISKEGGVDFSFLINFNRQVFKQ